MHHHGMSIMAALFATGNVVIALGYLAVPFLVLRYLPLTRIVLVWGAGFFSLCGTTHAGMAWLMRGDVGWFWTAEHVLQAVCTWGFILTFHRMLRAANAKRRPRPGGGDLS